MMINKYKKLILIIGIIGIVSLVVLNIVKYTKIDSIKADSLISLTYLEDAVDSDNVRQAVVQMTMEKQIFDTSETKEVDVDVTLPKGAVVDREALENQEQVRELKLIEGRIRLTIEELESSAVVINLPMSLASDSLEGIEASIQSLNVQSNKLATSKLMDTIEPKAVAPRASVSIINHPSVYTTVDADKNYVGGSPFVLDDELAIIRPFGNPTIRVNGATATTSIAAEVSLPKGKSIVFPATKTGAMVQYKGRYLTLELELVSANDEFGVVSFDSTKGLVVRHGGRTELWGDNTRVKWKLFEADGTTPLSDDVRLLNGTNYGDNLKMRFPQKTDFDRIIVQDKNLQYIYYANEIDYTEVTQSGFGNIFNSKVPITFVFKNNSTTQYYTSSSGSIGSRWNVITAGGTDIIYDVNKPIPPHVSTYEKPTISGYIVPAYSSAYAIAQKVPGDAKEGVDIISELETIQTNNIDDMELSVTDSSGKDIRNLVSFSLDATSGKLRLVAKVSKENIAYLRSNTIKIFYRIPVIKDHPDLYAFYTDDIKAIVIPVTVFNNMSPTLTSTSTSLFYADKPIAMSKLTVEFQKDGLEATKLHDPINLTIGRNSPINLLDNPNIVKIISEIENDLEGKKDYIIDNEKALTEFQSNDEPNQKVIIKFKGNVRIEKVPSSFSFSKTAMSFSHQQIFANVKEDTAIDIHDSRGDNHGNYEIRAKLEDKLTNTEDTSYQIDKGAVYFLGNKRVDYEGASVVASSDKSASATQLKFSNIIGKSESSSREDKIYIDIPSKSVEKAGNYKGTINWEIYNGP